jgi:ribosomal protein L34E
MRKNTAWLLAVVSDVGQSETLPDQKSWAEASAAREGWTIEREFSKAGSSGKAGVRALVDQMVAALGSTPEAKRPERILMIRLDRLGRGTGLDSMAALSDIYRLGTIVHTRQDGDVKLSRAADTIVPMFRTLIAGLENETRIDKAKATYERRRKARETDPLRAIQSKGPYGTRFENGYLVAQEPEAGAIRLMFSFRLQGYGSHVIGNKMAEVAPPLVQKNGTVRKCQWRSDLVSKLLKNRAYVDAGIVTETDWLRAQQLKSTKGGRIARKYEWPLAGALRCECGTSLQGMTNTRQKLFYYACSDRSRVHGKYVCHRREKVEQAFWSVLWTLNKTPIFPESPEADRENRKLLVARLSTLRAETTKIAASRENIFAAFDEGHIKSSALQGRLDSLDQKAQKATAEAAETEAKLEALKAQEFSAEEARGAIKTAASRWRKADCDDRKALAKLVARLFGGLTVKLDGTLLIGGPGGLAVNQ